MKQNQHNVNGRRAGKSSLKMSRYIRSGGMLLLLAVALLAGMPAAHALPIQPTISSLSSTSASPGSTITITGTNFNTTAANNIVYFGATRGTVVSATATSIVVKVPAGATHSQISVTNTGTQLTAYSGSMFMPSSSISQHGALAFNSSASIASGSMMYAVAAGDFDGDGKPDMVSTEAGNINIHQNISAPGIVSSSSFATKITIATNTDARAVTVGDVDGDGKLDIIVCTYFSYIVSIYRNISTGGTLTASSFEAKVDLAVPYTPSDVAVTDMDGDGHPDLVVGFYSMTVNVYRNIGAAGSISAASYAAPVVSTHSGLGWGMAVADFDGDNKPDIAVVETSGSQVFGIRNTSTPGTVSLATPVGFGISGSTPYSIAAGDINGDGKPELVATSSANSSLSVLQNNSTSGTLAFSLNAVLATGTNNRSVALADLDGDGKPDIVSGDMAGFGNNVNIFRNIYSSGSISSASFAGIQSYSVSSRQYTITVCDMDGDGKPDVLSPGANSASIYVLRNALPTVATVPAITSVSKRSAVPGTTIDIGGSNFSSTSANNIVYIGGIKAAVNTATTTSLNVTVPGGAAHGFISVNNTDLQLSASSPRTFFPTFYGNFYTTATPQTFDSKVDVPASGGFGVMSGDLNGDGRSDLISTDYDNARISILLNTGASSISTSSFGSPIVLSTTTHPWEVAVQDIDGDGKLDLAVSTEAGKLCIYRNNYTTGTFSASSFDARLDLTTPSGYGTTIGDLDGDGRPELVTTNWSSGSISIFHNISTPGSLSASSFDPRVNIAVGAVPIHTAIGDIDGDGKPDLVVSNRDNNNVSVFRNTAALGYITTASFATAVTFATASQPYQVELADMDGDNKLDMVIGSSSGSSISIFRNTASSGTITASSFASAYSVTSGIYSSRFVLGDVNGDGKQDIAMANIGGTNAGVYRNNSSPGFISLESRVSLTSALNPGGVAIMDIDNDKMPDFIVSCLAGGSPVMSLFRNSLATVAPPTMTSINTTIGRPWDTYFIVGSGFGAMTANNTAYFGAARANTAGASFNSLQYYIPPGATYEPFVVTNLITRLTGTAPTPLLPTYDNSPYVNDTFDFDVRTDLSLPDAPGSVAIGDLDGDGKSDIAVTRYDADVVSVYRNISATGSLTSSSFASPVSFATGDGPTSIAIGDLDGDAKTELVVTNKLSGTISVFANTGSSFAAKVDYATSASPVSVAIRDLDKDGKQDVIVATNAGTINVFRNDFVPGIWDAATLGSRTDFTSAASSLNYVTTSDIDGDGKYEIAATSAADGSVVIYRNISTMGTLNASSFAAKVTLAAGATARGLLIRDIDGDGKQDVVVSALMPSGISIFRNIGSSGSITTGSFDAKVDLAIAGGTLGIASGDLNGDGKPDLLLSNADSSYLVALRNTSTSGALTSASFVEEIHIPMPAGSQGVAIADLDKDYISDVIATVPSANSVAVIRNNPYAPNFPPSFVAGDTQDLSLCNTGVATSINSLLRISDANASQTETWTVLTAPQHGTISGSGATATSGTNVAPTGMTYLPATAYAGADTFAIQVNDGHGGMDTMVVYVTVSPSPAISVISNTSPICLGASFSLAVSVSGGTDTLQYAWSGPVGYSSTEINPSSTPISTTSSGTYSLSVTDGTCTATATTVVTVNPVPSITSITVSGPVCTGNTLTLSAARTGGTSPYTYSWSGPNSYTSTSLPASVIATSTAYSGTYSLDITDAKGCIATRTVTATVNETPVPVSGVSSICSGSASTFSDATAGGTWLSSNTAVATVGSETGVIVGNVAGSTIVSYKMPSGCAALMTVSVNATPIISSISDNGPICAGNTLSVSGTVSGGTSPYSYSWSGPASFTATDAATSIPTADVSATGTYSLSVSDNNGCVANATTIATVNEQPGAISGATAICVGSAVTFTNATAGGKWISGNTALATADSASGIITGIAAGAVTISYQMPSSCLITMDITVNATPSISSVTNNGPLCSGNTLSFTSAVTDGTAPYDYSWSGPNSFTSTASAPSIPSVTPSAAGVYTLTVSDVHGCTASSTTTAGANPQPAPVSGALNICLGNAATLADITAGGSWLSSDAATASVSSSGIVTGNVTGTATISYQLPEGCISTVVVTVNPFPAAITGYGSICSGNTATLGNSTTGGSWSSSNPAVASVDAATGVVTSGASSGSVIITYTSDKGCSVSTPEINPVADITGANGTCIGLTTILASATTGGVWSSSNTAVATVGSTGVVSALTGGVATITYAVGGCYRTQDMTMSTTPAAITGTATMCVGNALTVANASTGGTWSCMNAELLTLTTLSSGNASVIAVAAGNATLTYALSATCKITANVSINPLPAYVTGTFKACPGTNATLTDATSGGTWSSNSSSIATIDNTTGVFAGIAQGTNTITYTLPTGCYRTTIITINPTPAAIVGNTSICQGGTSALSDPTPAGLSWSSSNTAVASVNASSGIVSGVSAGSATVTYTVSSGCFITTVVSVTATPATIGGTLKVCNGAATSLTNTSTGGTWTSGNTAVGTIDASSGVITGIANGTTNVTYSVSPGCIRTAIVTVNPLPNAIGGTASLCEGTTTTLTNTGGGTWMSDDATIATIASTGIVSGLVAGEAGITYTLPSGCTTSRIVSVNAIPAAISGTLTMCVGVSSSLTSASTGGTWTSGNTSVIAAGSATGVVSGISQGTARITYTMPAGCRTFAIATVTAVPNAISGASSVNTGSSITLTNATTGGTWISSNTATASIGSSNGVVTGVAGGVTTISYTTGAGCVATRSVTVVAAPATLSGTPSACSGNTTTLSSSVSGGTWTSSNTSVATVDASGVVTAVAAGTSVISYAAVPGSYTTTVFTVNATPAAIAGPSTVCVGAQVSLTNATSGGMSWTSSNTSVATVVPLAGVVNGVAAGVTNITYTLNNGCSTSRSITVNPIPAAIAGTPKVCATSTITLTDADAGGTWTSSAAAYATVGTATGIVTGVAAGSPRITYTLSTGCFTSVVVTVNSAPTAISGNGSVCISNSATLTGSGSGTWSSSDAGIATVSAAGVVTGASAGSATITFTVGATGCTTVKVMTVNAVPGANTGTAVVCKDATTTLNNALTGGTWTSANTAYVTVGSATGIVTGMGVGTVRVSYIMPAGCFSISIVTVNASPGAISGTNTVCAGGAVTLNAAISGGTWSSSNTAVGTTGSISSSQARVAGISSGNTTITYTWTNSCSSVYGITVNPTPSAGVITSDNGFVLHTATVPMSATFSSSGTAGGAWTSSTPAKASVVSSTGVVTAVSAGSATITYTVVQGSCSAFATHTVSVLAPRSGAEASGGIRPATALSLYPNPSNGIFNLKGSIADADGDALLEIVSMTGQKAYSSKLVVTDGAIDAQINASDMLAPGMYLLSLKTSGQQQVFNLVISK